MLQRVWQGRIEDIPEKYKEKKIPHGYSDLIIYTDGGRAYHYGFHADSCQITEISRAMSRCWDSLSSDLKQELNEKVQKTPVDKPAGKLRNISEKC